MPFTYSDLISISDLSKSDILHILDTAKKIQQRKTHAKSLDGKIMATCFFEPSTRTRLSFEAAMKRLGGDVIGFADPKVTSAKKGETLSDSIRVIGEYADIIVIRHPLDGAARLAASVTATPVINAGDGANQHPTQTLLDLFTIRECHGAIDGLSIAFVGDLKYGRTVHSLTQALSHFSVRLYFVAPPTLQLPPHFCNEIKARQIKFSFHESISDVLPKADVLYMTRIQEERFADKYEYERVKGVYALTAEQVTAAKKSLAVLHPLPRLSEIHPEVDALPQAWYFKQAANGTCVRQAVLSLLLEKR